jgi:RimJ/RimL family protein N-acetyltransferase
MPEALTIRTLTAADLDAHKALRDAMLAAQIQACIDAARGADGLEMLTLTVTSGNDAASALYRQAGFERFGTLRRALKHAGRYHDKDHMVLTL